MSLSLTVFELLPPPTLSLSISLSLSEEQMLSQSLSWHVNFAKIRYPVVSTIVYIAIYGHEKVDCISIFAFTFRGNFSVPLPTIVSSRFSSSSRRRSSFSLTYLLRLTLLLLW